MNRIVISLFGVALTAGCASGGGAPQAVTPTPTQTLAQPETVVVASAPPLKAVEPQRFDMGKMWTLEGAPVEYFAEAYDFQPSEEWLEQVRLASLRIPGCTASFVSSTGLVMSNHHCARSATSAVTREGEQLLDNGFYAQTLDEERRVPDMWVDQMIEMHDVTDLIERSIDPMAPDAQQVQARNERLEFVGDSVSEASNLRCSVTPLYQGGRYSMYCFRRYEDVRLVFVPELQIGYYGGDADNFTYPRYNLDFSFFRVYDDNGEPLTPEVHYGWSMEGAAEGEATFVIGNPGSTERLSTVAQLEFNRDYREPYVRRLLQSRTDILSHFMEHHPDKRDEYINLWFGWMNSLKLYTGREQALNDPDIMGRKLGFEKEFRSAVQQDPQLAAEYGSLWEEIAEIRGAMAEVYPTLMALSTNGTLRSQTFGVATLMLQYAQAAAGGAADSALQPMRERLESWEIDPQLDHHMVQAQIEDAATWLGPDDPFVALALGEMSPSQAGHAILNESPSVTDVAARLALLDDPQAILNSDEAALVLMRDAMPRFRQAAARFQQLTAQEEVRTAKLARALFDVYGTDLPPDATFTLRIADGVVKGYEYNGTVAPAWTTFYGLYDRHYSHEGRDEWALPDRWLAPPAEFDLSTPLNMVSTNDITGGNSGSPVINVDREVVGLIFDGNIESLSGDFIYTTEVARSVSVRAEAILAALRYIYGADRIADELGR